MKTEIDTDLNMLNEAFKAFSETTTKLQDSYNLLEKRASYLSNELEKKNTILANKITELDQTQKYLTNILESISDGVMALDLNGNVNRLNKAAQLMTHYSPKEVMGKHFSELFPKWGVSTKKRIKDVSFPSGEETFITSRLKESIPVIAYTSLIADESANVIGVLITFKDLSKIKHLENEIERSKRLSSLGEMAAGVAHEIRNPLGGIEMYASVLNRECQGDIRKEGMTSSIIQGVRGLNKIITEMLTFTKSLDKTCYKNMNIVDCIESSLSFVAHEISNKKVVLIKDYNAFDDIAVVGDSDQLRQVFLNLILNAVQAVFENGQITISFKRNFKRRTVTVLIEDNGCGIAEDDQEKIFDPFFTTKSNGTGLGLAVSYRIIEVHAGKLDLRTKQNEGTIFEVTLPMAQ